MQTYQPVSSYRKPSKPGVHIVSVFVTNGKEHSLGFIINGNFHAAKAQFGEITHFAYIEFPPLPETLFENGK